MNNVVRKEFRNEDAVLDIKTDRKLFTGLVLSLQHLFTMFGATVLVPILVGIDPRIALVSSGLGTMVYLITTKEKSLILAVALLLLQRCRC